MKTISAYVFFYINEHSFTISPTTFRHCIPHCGVLDILEVSTLMIHGFWNISFNEKKITSTMKRYCTQDRNRTTETNIAH